MDFYFNKKSEFVVFFTSNYRNDEIELVNIAKHFFFKKHCYTHFSLEWYYFY